MHPKISHEHGCWRITYDDVHGNQMIVLLDQPVLVEHTSSKDDRDYPAAWGVDETLRYRAGEIEVTIWITDGRYNEGPEARVAVTRVQPPAPDAAPTPKKPAVTHESLIADFEARGLNGKHLTKKQGTFLYNLWHQDTQAPGRSRAANGAACIEDTLPDGRRWKIYQEWNNAWLFEVQEPRA